MAKAEAAVQLWLTHAEKKRLQEEAAAEGVSMSVLLYRRVFDQPDATRKAGRKPKNDPKQPEGLFDIAV